MKIETLQFEYSIIIANKNYTGRQFFEAINYNNARGKELFCIFNSCSKSGQKEQLYRVWDKALLRDLYAGLFQEQLDDGLLQFAKELDVEVKPPYKQRHLEQLHLVLQLVFRLSRVLVPGSPPIHIIPHTHSFLVTKIIQFAEHVKNYRKNGNNKAQDYFNTFAKKREWAEVLIGDYTDITPSTEWNSMRQPYEILAVLAIYSGTKALRHQLGVQDILAPDGGGIEYGTGVDQTRKVDQQTMTNIWSNIIGVEDRELSSGLQGALDELSAANLLCGPFKLNLTSDPSLHLKMTGSHTRSTVHLFDLELARDLYSSTTLSMCKFSECISSLTPRTTRNFGEFFKQVFDSYALFFLRDTESEKIGRKRGIDLVFLQNFEHTPESFDILQHPRSLKQPLSSSLFDFQLENFSLYASRLQYIQRKMESWRQQTLNELSIRPYKDPITFYAFWFAGFFGFSSILLVLLAIAQTYAAFKMLALTS